jgi:Protein of unknown function (DUF3570)
MKNNISAIQKASASAGVLMATLMLPGIAAVSTLAHAENAPEHGTLAFKYGTYKDWQPGWDRISVRAPHLYALVPLGKEWSLEGGLVLDTLSGATPRLHSSSDVSSATGYPGSSSAGMSDRRKAGDVKVTRYFSRSAVSVGAAYSKENDYLSKAISVDARFSSEDNNRTWSFGLGSSNDTIDSQFSQGVNAVAKGERKRTLEFMAGVTQVMTPRDIVQLNLTHSRGRGYFTDPYKRFDKRPDSRDSTVGLARWNHYVEPFDASLRTSYRYYNDTFGVASHTVGADWVQSAGKWTITPGVRYYAQRAAKFYFDGTPDAAGNYNPGQTITDAGLIAAGGGSFSADQRLSAYGALTASIKVDYAITDKTNVDFKLERYQQKSSYRLGGKGSPYIDPFNAQFVQVGLSTKF